MQPSITELIVMAMEVSMNGTKKVAVQFAPVAKVISFHFYDGSEIAKTRAIDVNNPDPAQIDGIFNDIVDGVELEVTL